MKKDAVPTVKSLSRRRAATVAHGPETAGDDLQMQFLMSVTHDRATLVSIAAQATRMTLTPTAS